MLLTTCMLGECCSSCFSRRSLVGKEAPHCAHWSGVIWSGEHWSAPGPGTAPATGDEDAGRAGGGGCGGAASRGAVGADGCGDAAGGAAGGGEDVGVEAAPWTVVMWSRSAGKPAQGAPHCGQVTEASASLAAPPFSSSDDNGTVNKHRYLVGLQRKRGGARALRIGRRARWRTGERPAYWLLLPPGSPGGRRSHVRFVPWRPRGDGPSTVV